MLHVLRRNLSRPNLDHVSGLPRPHWRGRLHLLAALAIPPFSVLLLCRAGSTTARVGACVFALGMLAVFATSASYHVLARTPRAQRVLRRMDHAAIYLLIAATITPISLLVPPPLVGIPVLVVAWTAALAGVFLKLTARRDRLAKVLYPAIGWSAAVMLPWLWRANQVWALMVLLAGVVYSLGALLFAKSTPRLSERVFGYHEFWHAMTLIAACLNYLAVSGMISSLS